jgi:hypothetical protein
MTGYVIGRVRVVSIIVIGIEPIATAGGLFDIDMERDSKCKRDLQSHHCWQSTRPDAFRHEPRHASPCA